MQFSLALLARAFFPMLIASSSMVAQEARQATVTPVREADARCEACHQAIYREYLKTPMANASGLAMERAIPGNLEHKPSGISYEVSVEDKSLWLKYRRPGAGGLEGKQRLEYFLGSGHLGVTYMYSIRGFLLESPVAYYSDFKSYDMKPGLGNSSTMPAALPMSSGCMRCHMSGVEREDPETINHYAGPPFLHGGITCESCHGDSREHVASRGKAAIINPVKLDAERRDSVCIICHLEGDTSVEHKGRFAGDYRPGDRISDYLSYFVYAGADMTSRGVSEIEELGTSRCKRMSGDRMSCMSCHDPHRSPSAEERPTFYRKKCLECHTQEKYVSEHYAGTPDCTSCHMPNGKAQNIPHVAWTDHRIRQRPDQLEDTAPAHRELVPLLEQTASERDLALAYSNLVADGRLSEASRAWKLLLSVQGSNPDDPAVLASLGYLAQFKGSRDQAIDYYRASLKLDPGNLSAENNLGTLLAQSGDLKDAASTWRTAFDHNADIETLGLNLSLADCRLGDRAAAQQVLRQVLLFSPDSAAAARRLRSMEDGTEMCSVK